VEVVSELFEGKRSVQRQRLVYKAIWDEMKDGGAVHAVDQIIAQTPDEAA
jgi:stress-induced morphogen